MSNKQKQNNNKQTKSLGVKVAHGHCHSKPRSNRTEVTPHKHEVKQDARKPGRKAKVKKGPRRSEDARVTQQQRNGHIVRSVNWEGRATAERTQAQHGMGRGKLQALVYDILPSTTAVFSYAIGSRKLSAKEQFVCWRSNSGKFVTNNSNKTRRVIYSRQQSLHQHK